MDALETLRIILSVVLLFLIALFAATSIVPFLYGIWRQSATDSLSRSLGLNVKFVFVLITVATIFLLIWNFIIGPIWEAALEGLAKRE